MPTINATTTPLKPAKPRGEPLCFSIAEFCERHGISVSMFYKLRKQGLGPDEIKVGDRWLITHEAAARWRADREAEALAAKQD